MRNQPPWASKAPGYWLVAPGGGWFASSYGRQGSRDLDELTSRVGWRRMQGCRSCVVWQSGSPGRAGSVGDGPGTSGTSTATHSATRPRSYDRSVMPSRAALQLRSMDTKEDSERPRYSRYCRLDWIPELRRHLVGWVGQDEEEFVQADARTRKG